MSNRMAFGLLLSLTLVGSPATAQTASPHYGVWRQDDGSVTVRIAACPQSTAACATVIAERIQPGEPSLLNQTVVRDMIPNGARRWRGRYVVDGQSLNATARLLSDDRLTMRVCALAFLCDSIRLERIGR
ncbi:MAG: hypothetical protein HC788_00465 [Sphingopyxis sp.]|nr:hypothetical protein [Sphingopyxis sp.]